MREALRAAALLGVDFAVPDLATVLGQSVADLIEAVDEARAAGVLTDSGKALSFRHPMIRAALYDEMPEPSARPAGPREHPLRTRARPAITALDTRASTARSALLVGVGIGQIGRHQNRRSAWPGASCRRSPLKCADQGSQA